MNAEDIEGKLSSPFAAFLLAVALQAEAITIIDLFQLDNFNLRAALQLN